MNNRDHGDLSDSHRKKYKVIMRQDLTGENSRKWKEMANKSDKCKC